MRYLSRVINYYDGFSSAITTYINKKEKTSISISGKLTKKRFIIFIFISLIFIILDIERCSDFTILVIIFSIIDVIMLVATIIKSKYIFFNLEHKPINLDLYKRELPSKLKPAHVRMLINDGLIDETSLIATIIDLIDKNYIELIRENTNSEISSQEKFILKKTNKSYEYLLEYEIFVIKWIIEKYGDGIKVHQDDIKNSLENDIYSERPCDLFEYFQSLVLISYPINKYYKHLSYSKKTLIYFGLITLGLMYFKIIGAGLLIYSLGCILFASPVYVLSDIGIEEKDNWLDFKRNLVDFSNMKEKTTEMVKI